jgi:putative component of membrane protein insertase Oxa1/YidC/SpoIIIJ protein YidD
MAIAKDPGLPMRPSLFASAATILLGALLLTGAALADEPLLRGPRKAVRVSAEAADSATGGPGAMEGIAAAPVRFYQRFLAPHWGNRCAHHPSCSHYALLAIRKHGAAVGLVMTFDRLQHESNEARYSPLIRIGGETKVHDPLENNDYWWYRADRSEPAVHGDD